MAIRKTVGQGEVRQRKPAKASCKEEELAPGREEALGLWARTWGSGQCGQADTSQSCRPG